MGGSRLSRCQKFVSILQQMITCEPMKWSRTHEVVNELSHEATTAHHRNPLIMYKSKTVPYIWFAYFFHHLPDPLFLT